MGYFHNTSYGKYSFFRPRDTNSDCIQQSDPLNLGLIRLPFQMPRWGSRRWCHVTQSDSLPPVLILWSDWSNYSRASIFTSRGYAARYGAEGQPYPRGLGFTAAWPASHVPEYGVCAGLAPEPVSNNIATFRFCQQYERWQAWTKTETRVWNMRLHFL